MAGANLEFTNFSSDEGPDLHVYLTKGSTEADVAAGKVRIYAPEGFLEAAVAENVMAGTAMSRRASYMYGNLLPPDPKGQVGAGLARGTEEEGGEEGGKGGRQDPHSGQGEDRVHAQRQQGPQRDRVVSASIGGRADVGGDDQGRRDTCDDEDRTQKVGGRHWNR